MQSTPPDGAPVPAPPIPVTGAAQAPPVKRRNMMVGPLGDEKRYRLVVESSRSTASELWHAARTEDEDPRRWAVLTERPDEATAHAWQPVWKARAERIRARSTDGVPPVDDVFGFHRRDGAALHMPGDTAVLVHRWFEGYPLRDWVRLHRPVRDRSLQLLRALAATVDSLHVPSDGAPLVHGDISPDNVIATVPEEGGDANDPAFRADVALLGFDLRTGDDTLSPTLDRGAMVRVATFLLIGADPGRENDEGAGPLGWRVADAFSRVGGAHNLPPDVRDLLSSDAYLTANSMGAWCDQLHQALTGVWSKGVPTPDAPPVPTTATPGAAPADVAAATAAAQAAAQQWAAPPLPADAEAQSAATPGFGPTAERIAAAAAGAGDIPPEAPGVAKTVSYIPAEDAAAGFADLPTAPPAPPPTAGGLPAPPTAPTAPLMAGPPPSGPAEPVRNPVTGVVLASAAGLVGLADATGRPVEPVAPDGWVPPDQRVDDTPAPGKVSRKERRERKRAAKAGVAGAAAAVGVATAGIPEAFRKPTGFESESSAAKSQAYVPKSKEEEAEADRQEKATGKRQLILAAVLLGVLAIGAGAWFFLLRGGETETAATTAPETTAAPTTTAPVETTAPPTTQAPTAPVQPAPAPATTGDPCSADVPPNGGWQVIMWSEFTQNAGPAQAEAEYQRLVDAGFPDVKLLRGDDWCSLRPGTWAVVLDGVLSAPEAIARENELQRETGDTGIYARCVGTVPEPCADKGPGR